MVVTYDRPPLYSKQESAFFGPERLSVILGSSKSGKTHAGIAWLLEQSIVNPQSQGEFWWLAPSVDQSKIAFNRFKDGLPASVFRSNDTDRKIRLINGSVLAFRTADNLDLLYGNEVHALLCDEASRCREETYLLIRSVTTATRGPIRLVGNAISAENWHYRLYQQASTADSPSFKGYSLDCYDAVSAGVLDVEEINDLRSSLSEQEFSSLYLNIVPDTSCPFGLENIRMALSEPSELPTVCWGIDLGKHHSYTVVLGLDQWGRWTEVHRWQDNWTAVVDRIQQICGSTPALVDSTGVGDPVLEQLLRAGIRAEGYRFTETSRQQLLESLAGGFQRGQLKIPEVVAAEARGFTTEHLRDRWRYQQTRGHDDAVMAAALAWWKYSRVSKTTFSDVWEAEYLPKAS